MDTKKLNTYSTKALQKLAQVKTGEELEQINAVLRRRGALDPDLKDAEAEADAQIDRTAPIGTTDNPYNGTETEDWEEEQKEMDASETAQEDAAPKKQRKQKTSEPKAPKAPRLSAEVAETLYKGAKMNKGCVVSCQHKGEPVHGVVDHAAFDKRKNSVQYFIKLEDGRVIGKVLSDTTLFLADPPFVPGRDMEDPFKGLL